MLFKHGLAGSVKHRLMLVNIFVSVIKEINRYVKHLLLRKTDVLKTSILSERKFEEMHNL